MAADLIDIRCPSCATEYELPESFRANLSGNTVVCARCSQSWVPLPASGLLGRLRKTRELPIDLIPYQKEAEDLFAGLDAGFTADVRPGPEASEASAGKSPPAPPPAPAVRIPARPPGPTAPTAPGAETVLDLGAKIEPPGGHARTGDPLRGLDIGWVGMEEPHLGKSFRVKRTPSLIGRAAGDLVIADERVSKKHAQLDVSGPGHYLLMDLASTNGTTVKGRSITTTRLEHGDVVSFGGVKFRFVAKARKG